MYFNAIKTKCVAALLAGLLSGCVSVPLGEEFLVLQNDPGEFRAVTSDEAKVWVRVFSDDKGGSLAFWTRALVRDFTLNRGYVLQEQIPFKDKDANEATLLRFKTTINAREYGYSILISTKDTLFGTDVKVSEFVAEKKIYEAKRQGVEDALGKASGAAIEAKEAIKEAS